MTYYFCTGLCGDRMPLFKTRLVPLREQLVGNVRPTLIEVLMRRLHELGLVAGEKFAAVKRQV